MPRDRTIHVTGDFFAVSGTDIADGNTLEVNPEDVTQYDAIEVHAISHGGSVDVRLETSSDPDTLVTDASVTLDSFSGEGISQHNAIQAGAEDDMYLVVENTSGGAIDIIVTGVAINE